MSISSIVHVAYFSTHILIVLSFLFFFSEKLVTVFKITNIAYPQNWPELPRIPRIIQLVYSTFAPQYMTISRSIILRLIKNPTSKLVTITHPDQTVFQSNQLLYIVCINKTPNKGKRVPNSQYVFTRGNGNSWPRAPLYNPIQRKIHLFGYTIIGIHIYNKGIFASVYIITRKIRKKKKTHIHSFIRCINCMKYETLLPFSPFPTCFSSLFYVQIALNQLMATEYCLVTWHWLWYKSWMHFFMVSNCWY